MSFFSGFYGHGLLHGEILGRLGRFGKPFQTPGGGFPKQDSQPLCLPLFQMVNAFPPPPNATIPAPGSAALSVGPGRPKAKKKNIKQKNAVR